MDADNDPENEGPNKGPILKNDEQRFGGTTGRAIRMNRKRVRLWLGVGLMPFKAVESNWLRNSLSGVEGWAANPCPDTMRSPSTCMRGKNRR